MGRQERRREAKKNHKKIVDNNIETEFRASTTIKIVGGVLLILLVLYYILAIFVTKEINISNGKDKNDNNTEEVSENTDSGTTNKILAAATFRQSPNVYYVYYYDFDEENEEVNSAIEGITDSNVYRVDTGDSLNSNYVTEDSGNKSVTDIGNLKVKNLTLIKIDNDKVVEYYEGKNDILEYLNK